VYIEAWFTLPKFFFVGINNFINQKKYCFVPVNFKKSENVKIFAKQSAKVKKVWEIHLRLSRQFA
jgi:hypothetical protein